MAVTSQQIAELAGVSRGTVDRALHNRGRVNPQVAERIRKIADELGYVPHPAGQALVLSNKQFKFGVYIQSLDTPTMQIVHGGIQRAAEELKAFGVTTEILTHPILDKTAALNALTTLIEDGCQGLAITPTTDDEVVARINQLTADGIPVVVFNGDAPTSDRLCYVGLDNTRGGRMAGALMGYMLPGGGKVLPLTAHLANYAHYTRAKSFMDVIASDFPNIELLPLQGCFDNDAFSYEITKVTLQEHPDLKGIYAASNGVHGAVRAIQEAGLAGKVRIISFDLNASNRRDLEHGDITIILDQHPDLEGYRPLYILYDYLAKGQAPADRNAFTPLSIVTKYNLD